MIILVDSDSLAYRASASVEDRVYHLHHGGEVVFVHQYKANILEFIKETGYEEDSFSIEKVQLLEDDALAKAKNICNNLVNDIKKEFYKAFVFEWHFTGSTNYRDGVATIAPYKGNRVGTQRPLLLKEIREYLMNDLKGSMVLSDGCEADDTVSIRAQELQSKDKDYVIVAIDKDLDTIEGKHFNWVKKTHYYINRRHAMWNFCMQWLEGDTTDNIKGVKGIGKKRAAIIFAKCTTAQQFWDKVVEAYDSEESMTENARLLWMSWKDSDDFSEEIFFERYQAIEA